MAAPRKTTQPVNTNSGDTTPMTDEEKARAAAAEQQPEQTPEPPTSPVETPPVGSVETLDGVQHSGEIPAAAIIAPPASMEDVVLVKEAGGHKSGDTITVTRGAAEYLREQGYVDSEDTDED